LRNRIYKPDVVLEMPVVTYPHVALLSFRHAMGSPSFMTAEIVVHHYHFAGLMPYHHCSAWTAEVVIFSKALRACYTDDAYAK